MKLFPGLFVAFFLLCVAAQAMDVAELWADFDPRAEPLETEIIREWQSDGLLLRYVRFRVGTFKGKPARLAAFYGFPADAKEKLPAVMHIHGGGQRANLDEVKALAGRGYAALSVNWGGREMEGAQPGDANTDWGAVDPTQQNVPGYNSMLPGPKQFFEDREDPRNCNWYLLTLGCRRGLTFLEQQPEVDPQRLGIHGYSMGGNLTMYVAGTDARVKAAVPAVGGQGWRWEHHDFLGDDNASQERIQGDLEVFRKTLSFESYAPLIRCPVLHRSATNDFHGWMDDVYRTDALIVGQPVRHSWSPHLNHRLIPEVAIAMPLWLDHFLKGGPTLPETPASELRLATSDGIPQLRVAPVSSWPVVRCDIYCSLDPDPRARFWRSAEVRREGNTFSANLPVAAGEAPLFAFANVFYTLPHPEAFPMPGLPKKIREVCLSTAFHRASADDLRAANVRGVEAPERLIDDFAHGWRDWYRLEAGNRDYWENWTRKITDPKWRGADGAHLALTLRVAADNKFAIIVVENEWRNYRGQHRTFIHEVDAHGSPEPQTITLAASDFKNTADGQPLKSWSQLDVLGVCAHDPESAKDSRATVRRWNGTEPEFLHLEWK